MNRSVVAAAFIVVCLMAGYAVAQTPIIQRYLPATAWGDPFDVFNGHIFAGDNLETDWPCAPDFLYRYREMPSPKEGCNDEGSPKLHVRSIIMGDIWDQADFAIRRAGNASDHDKTGPAEFTTAGTRLGSIYWQAWGDSTRAYPENDMIPGDWRSDTGNGRVAAISAKADGAQTKTSRPGKLCLHTTPVNRGGDPLERFCLRNDGSAQLWFNGALRDVEIGAVNSCGSGKRCLTIPN